MNLCFRRLVINFLIAGLFLAMPAIAAASTATPGIPDIEPPPLIECRTDATCDRDPQHLEAFVAGFYKWWLANEHAFDDIGNDKPSPAVLQKQIVVHAHYEKNIMQHWLTPDYYHWTTIYATDPPPHDPRYCDAGTAIVCVSAWNDDQVLNAPVKLIDIDKRTAKLTLTFPAMREFNENGHQLTVTLKVLKGQWRIDGVTRQNF